MMIFFLILITETLNLLNLRKIMWDLNVNFEALNRLKMKIQDQVKLKTKKIQKSVKDLVQKSIDDEFNITKNIVNKHENIISQVQSKNGS